MCIRDSPDTLRMGSTGAGGLPSTVSAMINAVDELKVREVTFGGDGPGITALMGKHIDFMPLSLAAARELVRSGKLKALAVFATEETPELPGVEPITKALQMCIRDSLQLVNSAFSIAFALSCLRSPIL